MEERKGNVSLSSKTCKFREFEFEGAVGALPSAVQWGVRQETDVLELTRNLYLVASIAWSNLVNPIYFSKDLPKVPVLQRWWK